MRRNLDLSKEDFDEILAWLNPDRERAGESYEKLRRSLIKIFAWNRCTDPEAMADETFNRVAHRASELRTTYSGDPRLYFYAVANNQIREFQKKVNLHVSLESVDPPASESPECEEIPDPERECFRTCLQKLSPENRELILDYYQQEKQAKIDQRKRMAQHLGVAVNALRVRMYRIRASLEDCIEDCLEQRASKK